MAQGIGVVCLRKEGSGVATLTEEQRKARQAEYNRKHYEANKAKLLERSRVRYAAVKDEPEVVARRVARDARRPPGRRPPSVRHSVARWRLLLRWDGLRRELMLAQRAEMRADWLAAEALRDEPELDDFGW